MHSYEVHPLICQYDAIKGNISLQNPTFKLLLLYQRPQTGILTRVQISGCQLGQGNGVRPDHRE